MKQVRPLVIFLIYIHIYHTETPEKLFVEDAIDAGWLYLYVYIYIFNF